MSEEEGDPPADPSSRTPSGVRRLASSVRSSLGRTFDFGTGDPSGEDILTDEFGVPLPDFDIPSRPARVSTTPGASASGGTEEFKEGAPEEEELDPLGPPAIDPFADPLEGFVPAVPPVYPPFHPPIPARDYSRLRASDLGRLATGFIRRRRAIMATPISVGGIPSLSRAVPATSLKLWVALSNGRVVFKPTSPQAQWKPNILLSVLLYEPQFLSWKFANTLFRTLR